MDLEKLSKSQIILLAVLVSFITSIATGILTVSMLDNSSGGVSQTVHKVVERTVEKVYPESKENAASVGDTQKVEKETTVVVKEGDMITSSIEKNMDSLVRINKIIHTEMPEEESSEVSTTSPVQTKDKTEFTCVGVVVSKDGLIAVPSSLAKSGDYEVEFNNGKILNVVHTGVENDKLALLKIESEDDSKLNLNPVIFANVANLSLGKSVITISGVRRSNVAIGIVSALPSREVVVESPKEENMEDKEDETQKEKKISKISAVVTDIDSDKILTGSPLITIFNKVAGIAIGTGLSGEYAEYVPAFKAKELLDKYKNLQANTEENKENN